MTGPVSFQVIRPAVAEPRLTVAFIHGLGSSTSVWEQCVTRLPADLQVWALGCPWDARHGSAWALERDSRVWLERALSLAPAWPDVFVAHSFGADVLLDYLVDKQLEACRGLVLLSPFYRATPKAFDWSALAHYLNDFDDLVRAGILLRRGQPPDPELLTAMVERVRERIGPYGWLRFFELFLRMPMLDLSGLRLPSLVIAGGRDTAAYPADCHSLALELPNAGFELLATSGHFSMVDDPDRVAALIADFLEGLADDL